MEKCFIENEKRLISEFERLDIRTKKRPKKYPIILVSEYSEDVEFGNCTTFMFIYKNNFKPKNKYTNHLLV